LNCAAGAAAQFVLVRQAVNEEAGVVGALAEHWRCIVIMEIRLPVDGHARDQLH